MDSVLSFSYWFASSKKVSGWEDGHRHGLFYHKELTSLGLGSRGRAVRQKGKKDNLERQGKGCVSEKCPRE